MRFVTVLLPVEMPLKWGFGHHFFYGDTSAFANAEVSFKIKIRKPLLVKYKIKPPTLSKICSL